jgi:hypothetical protein
MNPKIGSQWIVRGQQAEVTAPGNNEKRHVAGSFDWRTGTLFLSSPGTRRNAELFLAHIDHAKLASWTYSGGPAELSLWRLLSLNKRLTGRERPPILTDWRMDKVGVEVVRTTS